MESDIYKAGSNRSKTIDVMKGIGIILVIIGHLIPPDSYAFRWIFSFHMPLFFLLFGYCYKEERFAKRSLVGFYIKNFCRFVIPSWIYVNIFHCIRIGYNEYFATIRHNPPAFIIPQDEWFLPTIFMAGFTLLIYVKIRSVIKNKYLKRLFAVFAGLLSFYLSVDPAVNMIYERATPVIYFRFEHLFMALSFMIIGFSLRNDMELKQVFRPIRSIPGFIILLMLTGVFLNYIRFNTTVNLCDRLYGTSFFMFYACALFWIGILSLVSKVICRYIPYVPNILAFWGRYTLAIYIGQGILIILSFPLGRPWPYTVMIMLVMTILLTSWEFIKHKLTTASSDTQQDATDKH